MADKPKAEIVISAVDEMKSGVDSAVGQLNRLKGAGDLLQRGFGGIGGGLAAAFAGAGLVQTIGQAIDSLDQMDESAERIGVTTEALSGLAYAGKQTGLEFEEVGTALTKLSVKMAEAVSGDKEAAKWFADLGIKADDLVGSDGKLIAVDAAMGKVADGFAKMSDGAGKTSMAVDGFGAKMGAKMVPLLNAGSDGIRDLIAEGESLGAVIDGKIAHQAAQFNDNLDRLGVVSAAAGKSLAGDLLPALNTISENLLVAIKNSDGFWSSLWRFATMNPFKDHSLRLIEMRNEFEQLDYKLSNGRSANEEADRERMDALQKEIRTYEQLEEAKVAAEKPRAVGDERPLKKPESVKKKVVDEATEAAKAYEKAMEGLAKAGQDADIATLGLTGTQRTLYELMTSPVWAEMPETWRLTAAAEFEAAYAAEQTSAQQKKLNELIASLPSSQIAALTKEYAYLEQMLYSNTITAAQFHEAVALLDEKKKSILGLKDAAQETADGVDMVITNGFREAADAVVNFGQAGQKSFGDLIASMIRNILRLELEMTATALWKSAGGSSGIFGFLGSALGNLFGGGSLFGGGMDASFANLGQMSNAATMSGYDAMSFAGGGYTGNAPRSGGLDGQGGFLAMLHPQETVSDHYIGQPGPQLAPAITINNYGTPQQAQTTSRWDGERWQVELATADVYAGGELAAALESTYGLRRPGR